MNLPNRFRSQKKKAKRKQKKEDGIVTRYILEGIDFHQDQVVGYGPTKSESCETSSLIDQSKSDQSNKTASGGGQRSKKGQPQNTFYFFAVFDGHGTSGKDASFAASDYVQQYLESRSNQIKKMNKHSKVENLLKQAFKTTEQKLKGSGIDYSNSGTCCASVFIKGQMCYVANLGDSRVVLYRQQQAKGRDQNKVQNLAIELSWDHKPTRPDERERVNKKGGKIEKLLDAEKNPIGPYRVWEDEEGPGIAITRALGDFGAKRVGLISEPEIQYLELTKDDQFIVVASDGIWKVMSSGDVIGFLIDQIVDKKILEKEAPNNNPASELCKLARAKWDQKNEELKQQKHEKQMKKGNKKENMQEFVGSCDDITAMVGLLKFREETVGVKKGKKSGAKGKRTKK